MKKIVLALVCLLVMTAQGAFAQSDKEIAETILKSRDVNKGHGITDPNLIYPGQIVEYMFADGSSLRYEVTPQQTQWLIAKAAIAEAKKRGAIVSLLDPIPQVTPEEVIEGSDSIAPISAGYSWWDKYGDLFLLFGACFLAVCLLVFGVPYLRSISERRKISRIPVNPATSGPAMTPGGITAENVRQVMHENAQRAYPGSTVRVIRTEHGTLDSNGVPKLVSFRDGTRQLHVLNNRSGVRATIAVAGQEGTRYVYSLLECANDVRSGGGISDEGIVFTPLSVLSLSPLNTTEESASVENETNLPDVVGSGATDFELLTDMIPEAMNKLGVGGAKNFEVNYANNGVTLQIKVSTSSTEPVKVKES